MKNMLGKEHNWFLIPLLKIMNKVTDDDKIFSQEFNVVGMKNMLSAV